MGGRTQGEVVDGGARGERERERREGKEREGREFVKVDGKRMKRNSDEDYDVGDEDKMMI